MNENAFLFHPFQHESVVLSLIIQAPFTAIHFPPLLRHEQIQSLFIPTAALIAIQIKNRCECLVGGKDVDE